MLSTSYYRSWVKDEELTSFSITYKETDLFVRAELDFSLEVMRILRNLYTDLEDYIRKYPLLLYSLTPVDVPCDSPLVVRLMTEASKSCQVGPMAAVAGAIAQLVGEEIVPRSAEVIVENGGDIYLRSARRRVVAIYAGDSALNGRLGLVVSPSNGMGVCTSSGTVGHSLSFGTADAVTVVAPSVALADAAATAICNQVISLASFQPALDLARSIDGISGVLIIKGDSLGAWGELELCEI